jgi:hypothetical protein
MQRKLLEFINVDFGQQNIYCSYILLSSDTLEKKWEYNGAVHALFLDFKKAYNPVRREVLYNILIEFGISMKLVSLINVCLTGKCCRVRVGKNLSDIFFIRCGLKQGDTLLPLLFNFALEYTIRRV